MFDEEPGLDMLKVVGVLLIIDAVVWGILYLM